MLNSNSANRFSSQGQNRQGHSLLHEAYFQAKLM